MSKNIEITKLTHNGKVYISVPDIQTVLTEFSEGESLYTQTRIMQLIVALSNL